MSNSSVVIPPDLSPLITDRERVWLEFDRSQQLSAELNQLSSHVPQCAPANLQLPFGAGSTPPAELEAVLPMLKQNLATTNNLHAEVQACHSEIEAIKRKEKNIITGAVIAGVLLLLVLFILLLYAVSGS
ncbi:MAG: hypothetical protein ACJ74T_08980 [Pyrinomonadaceae bacterium]